MRRAAVLAAAAGALAGTLLDLLLDPFLAHAADAGYTVGAGGWASERFGERVAILRAPVGSPSWTGLLLLSCEGSEHRFRLALPEPIALPRPGTVRGGTMLVRDAGGTAREPGSGRVVAAVSLAGDRVLSRAETAARPGSVVTALAELLRARPARLDLLFRPDGAPRLPARAVPVVLNLVWRDADILAVDDFSKACAR